MPANSGWLKSLAGGWHGPITDPGQTPTFVTKFKKYHKGELTGTLSVPEQGGIELPISDIAFADNKLDFKVAAVKNEVTAAYANGAFKGLWRQGGNPPAGLPVVLKKGDVAAPIFPLKLSAESFAALSGKWSCKLMTPQATVTLVLHLDVNSGGQYVGSFVIRSELLEEGAWVRCGLSQTAHDAWPVKCNVTRGS